MDGVRRPDSSASYARIRREHDQTGGSLIACRPLLESAAQAFVDPTATAKLLDLIDLAHRRGTGSYKKFASGYFLTTAAMRWFWDHHATDSAQRAEITDSPLMATYE